MKPKIEDSMPAFQFKQFQIQQDHSAFKVGTDSILLGAWAQPHSAKAILDIGTGTGILALMMAQKTKNTESPITAIELDAASAEEAKSNAQSSPWSNRVTVIHQSLQNFAQSHSGIFEFLISNPPYFTTTTLTADPRIASARNVIQLPFMELANGAAQLLRESGRFCLILPVNEALQFVELARTHNLALRRRCRVFSIPNESYEKRHLLEFEKKSQLGDDVPVEESSIIIETGNRHHYTDEFSELTKDFYLPRSR